MMSHAQRTQTLTDIAAIVRELLSTFDDVVGRMATNAGALHAVGYEAHSSGVGTYADPTANAALSGNATVRDLQNFDRMLGRAHADLTAVVRLTQGYRSAEVARTVEAEPVSDIPHCELCARICDTNGRRRWEPVHSHLSAPTTVNDRLAKPLWLCRWCYETTLRWGRAPTERELQVHHSGRRVPWPNDVERPA